MGLIVKAHPPSIAVIGAGSISHGRRLLDDLLTVAAMDGCTISLMAPKAAHLAIIDRYARRAVSRNRLATRIVTTTDRAQALEGADYVVALFDVGGFAAFDVDYRIAQSYGLDVCIGDSSGPTGVMKALRNGTLLKGLADDMRRYCPDAYFVSYANPMGVLVMAAHAFGISRVVGLCGGAEATRNTVAACLGVRPADLRIDFGGINHMCWALSIERDGKDLYPQFRERLKRPEYLTSERVRFEMMQQFGYFTTETSGHLSDFFPWFRRDDATRRRYCSVDGYSGATGAFHKFSAFLDRHLGCDDYLQYDDGALAVRSDDYCASLIEAIETGRPYSFIGNVMNLSPAIDNLPASACVEVPMIADASGLRPVRVGALPPQLAALCNSSITSQQLTLQAIISGDPELAFAAIALDPLTSAVLDLPQTRRLTAELLAANKPFLLSAQTRGLRATLEVQETYPVKPAIRHHESLTDTVRTYERMRRLNRQRSGEPNRD